jgi:hypothetical protein
VKYDPMEDTPLQSTLNISLNVPFTDFLEVDLDTDLNDKKWETILNNKDRKEAKKNIQKELGKEFMDGAKSLVTEMLKDKPDPEQSKFLFSKTLTGSEYKTIEAECKKIFTDSEPIFKDIIKPEDLVFYALLRKHTKSFNKLNEVFENSKRRAEAGAMN